jgi:hypothetical protein
MNGGIFLAGLLVLVPIARPQAGEPKDDHPSEAKEGASVQKSINAYFQELADYACRQTATEESRFVGQLLAFACSPASTSEAASLESVSSNSEEASDAKVDWQYIVDDIDGNFEPNDRRHVHDVILTIIGDAHDFDPPAAVFKQWKFRVAFLVLDHYVHAARLADTDTEGYQRARQLVANIFTIIQRFERELSPETIQFFRNIQHHLPHD